MSILASTPAGSPEWTDLITDNDKTGEDHLGVEGAAQSYQQALIPGVISTTNHARYYAFYSWVLFRFIHGTERQGLLSEFQGSYFRRHEVAYLLACFSHHKERGGYKGIIGAGTNQIKARRLWEKEDPISLDFNYFGNKLGGFGQYYRPVMQEMGLVAPNDDLDRVYKITPRGIALAEAFEASIRGTTYMSLLNEEGELATISRAAAAEYGERVCLCVEALGVSPDRANLLDAFFRFDAPNSGGGNPHANRRQTLGLILDMVGQAGDVSIADTLSKVLHLGEFGITCLTSPMPCSTLGMLGGR